MGLIKILSRAGNLKADLTFYMHYRYIVCCSDLSGITGNHSAAFAFGQGLDSCGQDCGAVIYAAAD